MVGSSGNRRFRVALRAPGVAHRRTRVGIRIAPLAAAVAVLSLAGCGGGGTATVTVTTATPRHAPGDIPLPPKKPVTSNTYSVPLSPSAGTSGEFPAPPGSPNASGLAAISIHAPTGQLCWTFSQLQNVVAPRVALIYNRPAGAYSYLQGFALGHAYKPSGCVHRTSFNLRLIETYPQRWYISIHTARFPGGAVRGSFAE
jgi:CHRD domain